MQELFVYTTAGFFHWPKALSSCFPSNVNGPFSLLLPHFFVFLGFHNYCYQSPINRVQTGFPHLSDEFAKCFKYMACQSTIEVRFWVLRHKQSPPSWWETAVENLPSVLMLLPSTSLVIICSFFHFGLAFCF